MANKESNKEGGSDRIVKELESIKRLLILHLQQGGLSQEKIGAALGVNQTTISRMLPRRPRRQAKSEESQDVKAE